ncbi:TPA: hypothetical protein N0F65_008020 [Lagenidium giganteum]|uniref:SWIM-type domain-containing protein n=1 Tax=Lagenidium giganteum TaxID=4803 RepID=A0AAV2YL72_9STRA|nr:TPA: hypothetical protein N0F65_008020 [Lagenidium giganteum]
MTAQLMEVDGECRVVIKRGVVQHNPEISKAVFKTYASNRGIKDPQTKAQGENIVKRDIDNLVASFKAKQRELDDDDACAKLVVRFQALKYERCEVNESEHANKIGQRVNQSYDQELHNVLKFTNHFVAERVAEQYAAALNKADRFLFDEDSEPGSVIVHGRRSSYKEDFSTFNCTCPIASSMRLPCQHAMAFRKTTTGYGTVVGALQCGGAKSRVPIPLVQASALERRQRRGPLDVGSERYKEACRITHGTNDELTDISSKKEFKEFADFLMSQWRAIRLRKRTKLVQLIDVSQGTDTDNVDQDTSVDAPPDTAAENADETGMGDDVGGAESTTASEASGQQQESASDDFESDGRKKTPEKAPVCWLERAKKVGRPPNDRANEDAADAKAACSSMPRKMSAKHWATLTSLVLRKQ